HEIPFDHYLSNYFQDAAASSMLSQNLPQNIPDGFLKTRN
ncbi:hypothetical protein C8R32_1271, partial [Nitrosospira sp. Nsp5]